MDADVFNGDADGICSLLQLHHAEPRESRLVTGVKRDVQLLARVQAEAGDRVRALDISLDKNRDALLRILDASAQVFYVDHHYAGEIPQHPGLQALIDTSADVCTSLLVNRHLQGAFAAWAVVGAYGDNLQRSAADLGSGLGLSQAQMRELQSLGVRINYNSYGAQVEDLHFPPDELFRLLSAHPHPGAFLREDARVSERLERGCREDLEKADAVATHPGSADGAVIYLLPTAAWARRVGAVFGNLLSNRNPSCAHAIVMELEDGGWLVSVRAPQENLQGADALCRAFPTGGGRAGAAGINRLPQEMLQEFLDAFVQQYGKERGQGGGNGNGKEPEKGERKRKEPPAAG